MPVEWILAAVLVIGAVVWAMYCDRDRVERPGGKAW